MINFARCIDDYGMVVSVALVLGLCWAPGQVFAGDDQSCLQGLGASADSFAFPSVRTFYAQDSNSVIDHESYAEYRESMVKVDSLATRLADCANRYVAMRDSSSADAVLAALVTLARKGPVRGGQKGFQARVSAMMYGLGFAAAYGQVRSHCRAASSCSEIDAWIVADARASLDFFSRRPPNNLTYWAATQAVLAGRLASRPDLVDKGGRVIAQGWSRISENGFESERRGARTRFYNEYALAALSWGTAFQGLDQLEITYKQNLGLRLMTRKLAAGDSEFNPGGKLPTQDQTRYPAWCAPWSISGLLSCRAVSGAAGFNRILGGNPELMLRSAWNDWATSR